MQDRSAIIDKIRTMVINIGGFTDRVPAEDDDLLEVGFIASVEILTLINELEEAFHIEFGPFDILPENFSTLNDIGDLVAEKMAA